MLFLFCLVNGTPVQAQRRQGAGSNSNPLTKVFSAKAQPKKHSFNLQPGEVKFFPIDFSYNPQDVKVTHHPPSNEVLEVEHDTEGGKLIVRGKSVGRAQISIPTASGNHKLELAVSVKSSGNTIESQKDGINEKMQYGNNQAKGEAAETFMRDDKLTGQGLSEESKGQLEELLTQKLSNSNDKEASRALDAMEKLLTKGDQGQLEAIDKAGENLVQKALAERLQKENMKSSSKEQVMKAINDKNLSAATRLKALKVLSEHGSPSDKEMNDVSKTIEELAGQTTGEDAENFAKNMSQNPSPATTKALTSMMKGGQCNGMNLCQIFSSLYKKKNPALVNFAIELAKDTLGLFGDEKAKNCALIYAANMNKHETYNALGEMVKKTTGGAMAEAIFRASDILMRDPGGIKPIPQWQQQLTPLQTWYDVQLSSLAPEKRQNAISFLAMLSAKEQIKTLVDHMYSTSKDVRAASLFGASLLARPSGLEIIFAMNRFEKNSEFSRDVEGRLYYLLEHCPECKETVARVYLKSTHQEDRDLAKKVMEKKLRPWPAGVAFWPVLDKEILPSKR